MAAEDRAGQPDRPDPAALVDALAAAKAALAAAEAQASDELIAAKLAYRDDPTPENKARKAVAVASITAIRAAVRADRPGTQVGGDAYTGEAPAAQGGVR